MVEVGKSIKSIFQYAVESMGESGELTGGVSHASHYVLLKNLGSL